MHGATTRPLVQIIPSVATSDGAGVSLRRSLGSQRGLYLDPFLMLDEFFSDNPDDYLAGFPSHPHRGFETVTYMLDGHMRHQDHLGNTGDLGPGDVQWMTAARGIIHSEMPQQSAGRMRGFQLWINLPAAEKMKAAHYRDIPSAQIPTVQLGQGGEVRLIAGRFRHAIGPINGSGAELSTDPLYLDVHLAAGIEFNAEVIPSYSAFIYVYEGDASVGPAGDSRALPHRSAGVLGSGEHVRVQAGPQGARLLLLSARPLREPVVQYGPFVMNTREEIEQAVEDYRSGRLAATA